MYIKSLTIKNFRCFNNTGIKVEFNNNLTTILGSNGSGKTTILEGLNYLIGQEYLPTKISEKDFNCGANNIDDEILIECETQKPFFQTMDLVTKEKFNIAKNVIIPCNGIRLKIKRREQTDKVLDDPYIITKTIIPVIGNFTDNLYEDIKGDYKTFDTKEDGGYIISFKLKNDEVRTSKILDYQLTYNPSKLQNLAKSYYLDKYRDKEITGNYSFINKVLTDLHWKYKNKGAENSELVQTQYDTVAQTLREAVDEKGILITVLNEKVKSICSDYIELQLNFIDTEQPYKTAFLTKLVNGKMLLPENLGSGFNILIAYALFSFIAEKEKTPIVLIIDEPELHLHSDWQHKLYEVLSNQMQIQIVLSSQSENFLSFKKWEQIRLIKDNEMYPKVEKLQQKIDATGGDVGSLADYLNEYAEKNLHISCILKENLEMFFCKKVILVEGASEKYAIPKLLNLNGIDITEYSISIIPAWGKAKIKIYQIICLCFGLDFYVIYDADKKENDEPEAENTAIQNNVHNDQMTKYSTNFEELIGVSGEAKFQKLVRKIDEITTLDGLHAEIVSSIKKLTDYIKR